MFKKTLLAAATATLLISGSAFAADKAAAEAAIANAKAAGKMAKAAQGEWRDTAKMLKKAAGMVEKGKFADAVKMANKAKFQYEMGTEQAKGQAGVGNPGYLYN